MPFNYPATEVFGPAGTRRVVWSGEEFLAALAEGWTEEKSAAIEPAAPAPTPEPEQPKRKRGGK